MAGLNNTNAAWNGGTLNAYQEDNTSRPKSAFTGVTSNTGNHVHPLRRYLPENFGETWKHMMDYAAGGIGKWDGTNTHYSEDAAPIGTAGNHTHTVTINGGGDGETRPKTYSVNYFIKIN